MLYYIFSLLFIVLLLAFLKKTLKFFQRLNLDKSKRHLGIFHPYCDSGGGGERVLWTLVYGILESEKLSKDLNIAIYTGGYYTKHLCAA